jgi:hypothetical protein
MPGLADMHVHLDDAVDDLSHYLNYGVTTIRSMDGRPQHVEWKKLVEAGQVTNEQMTGFDVGNPLQDIRAPKKNKYMW